MRRTLSALFLAGLIRPLPTGAAQQPGVRYLLQARVDDSSGVIRGIAEVRYRHFAAAALERLTLSLSYNAFRPGAVGWPRKQAFRAADTGFERVFDARLDGAPATLEWPAAPDSSKAILVLAQPLSPGDSVLVSFSWEARPPALGWRLDRQNGGRRLQLDGWYPQVLDETSTSVPFAAFASVLAQLDLRTDQIIGGTGVPLCGDPGWAAAAAGPSTRVTLQREWYRAPRDSRAAQAKCDDPGAGWKRLAWYAEQVSGITLVMSPSFRYEEGEFLEKPVHALYERGREGVWGAGFATRRAETAWAWLVEQGGGNPWPHLTIVEGLDQAGAAAPMVLLARIPAQATLLELLGLMTTQQILAGGNRAFTVGTAAHQAAWFFEALGAKGHYARLEREILDWDLDRLALHDEPLGPEEFISPCATTFCRRAEFMGHQLRRWVGGDEPVRVLYGTLYSRFALQPTRPGLFQQLARELIEPPPDSLFAQLPRGGTLYDDAVRSARRERLRGGGWRATVELERRAPGIFPRTVWVISANDTIVAHVTAFTPRETLVVETRTRPQRVVLDPLVASHDWNMLNNHRSFGLRPGWIVLAPQRPTATYLDTYFSRRTARDRLTLGWAPTAWYNDAGGWTFGLRLREDYLGRFELNELWLSAGTGWHGTRTRPAINARLRLKNPVALRSPGLSEQLELAREEGRLAVRLEGTRRFRSHASDSTWRSLAAALEWVTVTDPRYLDSRYYDDAGTAELITRGRLDRLSGPWPFRLDLEVAGGYAYPSHGATVAGGGYGRLTIAASTRLPLTKALSIGARLYAGAAISADSVPRQRRIYLAGGDAYQRFNSPFLRSKGSLLSGSGFFYEQPGGAGVRGLDPRLVGDRVLGGSLELEYALRWRLSSGPLNRMAVAAFGDLARGNGDLAPGRKGGETVGDAGVGLRLGHRVGQTRFVTRFDFPLWVSRPSLAYDHGPERALGFRWGVSFAPAF